MLVCAVCYYGQTTLTYHVSDNRKFWCVQLSPRTRNNGLKLCKAHCNINARKSFFNNRIVKIWNSLPSAVAFSHNVHTFKCRLKEFNVYRFLNYK